MNNVQHLKSFIKIDFSTFRTEKNFLFNPYLDFTRKRKLSFNELIKFIICMKSGAIEDKLYKYFKN